MPLLTASQERLPSARLWTRLSSNLISPARLELLMPILGFPVVAIAMLLITPGANSVPEDAAWNSEQSAGQRAFEQARYAEAKAHFSAALQMAEKHIREGAPSADSREL